jgi:hypothetical protein
VTAVLLAALLSLAGPHAADPDALVQPAPDVRRAEAHLIEPPKADPPFTPSPPPAARDRLRRLQLARSALRTSDTPRIPAPLLAPAEGPGQGLSRVARLVLAAAVILLGLRPPLLR